MFRVVLLCAIVFASYFAWISLPVSHGYGELIPDPPALQRVLVNEPFRYHSYTLVPEKTIKGSVRVVDKKRYLFDKKSEIAPLDIVAGWQQMSDEAILDDLYLIQKKRTASIRYLNPPIPQAHIQSQSALWHLIPANDVIARKMHQIRQGHILHIEGWFVEVETESGYTWNSEIHSDKNIQLKRSALWVMDLEIE
jgi:hypothetical protein